MNLVLITVCMVFLVGVTPSGGAPAVTSVHVSFVSGNKKTQYSHGSHTRPAVVQYNLDAAGTGDDLLLRRLRSISEHQQGIHHGDYMGTEPTKTGKSMRRVGLRSGGGGTILLVAPTTVAAQLNTDFKQSDVTKRVPVGRVSASPKLPRKIKRKYRGSPSPLTFAVPSLSTGRNEITQTPQTTTLPLLRRFRSRNHFVDASTSGTPSTTSGNVVPSASSPSYLSTHTGSIIPPTPTSADIKKDSTKNNPNLTKPKDTKAVKRSPYIENFESRGITFPDFDEFGGNEFGALRNLIGNGGGGGGSVAAHSHSNPESLSPDGVFLPPLPTEATDYTEDGHGQSDPYVTDPETAKYAAQHPPFFAAFPHKRTVLDLNERRVEQGLEPNILRSIRPYFAFFEAAK